MGFLFFLFGLFWEQLEVLKAVSISSQAGGRTGQLSRSLPVLKAAVRSTVLHLI